MTKIDTSIEQLNRMKNQVALTKTEKDEAKGEEKALLVGLKAEHKITSLKQLSKKIDSCMDQLKELEEDVIDGVKSLREQYDWS